MKKYFSKEAYNKVRGMVGAHKIISAIVLVAVLGLGYYGYSRATTTSGETRYVMTSTKKGTIVSTVSGSGQVSATNQIDVKAKVSGEITWINAKAGQVVRAGQGLAGIDNETALQAVKDAEASLVQTKLQFQKDQASAPIDYQKSLNDLQTSKNDLVTEYNNTYNTVSNTFLDLPNIATGMQNILYGYDVDTTKNQWNVDALINRFTGDQNIKVKSFADKALSDYKIARSKYDASALAYKQINRTSDNATLEAFLVTAIDTTTAVAQALQSELNFLGTVIDTSNQYNFVLPSVVNTMQTNTRNYLSTTNSDLSSLLAEKKALDNAKQAVTTNEQDITLLQVGNTNGSNPISLQIEQNNLTKQEQDLSNLKANLNDYVVVAPFAGTLSSVSAQVGDSAGTIATLITNQQVAQLSLNEIDAAKVSLGQKATLTFDAISDLSLTGTVGEIDPVGTVSQGVVSYTVKITFDSQDPRIKPGMTVNASIQTEVHQDVLYVPSGSVKTSNGESYVLAFNPPLVDSGGTQGVASVILPTQIFVQTGISDDTNIEILSGLTEGEQIVSRTITGTTANKTTPSAPSATSLLGGSNNRTGGAGIRIGGN